jgi:LuxR family quorum sensing-dependent transcriptional regulator
MSYRPHRNLIFDTIDHIARLTVVRQVADALVVAAGKLGFSALGVNRLPAQSDGADPRILTESAPEGFRDLYIHERFYLVDHICAHARAAYEPFRYSDAPFARTSSRGHQRFMQALDTFGMGRGLIVPVGWPATIPACVWLAGANPNLDEDANRATELIALFGASKAHALSRPSKTEPRTRKLTPREREVLQWIAAGKTSWEISMILRLSERAIIKTTSGALSKLNAVSRAQAVVNAIRSGEIEL